jgi:hypothetical protein
MIKDKKIISVSEAARILEISESKFRRSHISKIDHDILPSGHYAFLQKDVEKYASETESDSDDG